MNTPDFKSLRVGKLMWANVPDSNGNPIDNDHLVTVLSGPFHDSEDQIFYICCAGSRAGPRDDQEKLYSVMQTGISPNGHARTKLKWDTWFYANWIVSVHEHQVSGYMGVVPEHYIYQLRTIAKQLDDKLPL